MDQQQWTRRETGWQSGRYSIELLAPGFWVLTRSGDSPDPESVEVLASSGFRSALVAIANQLESRRRRRWRITSWSTVLALSIIGLVWTYYATLSWAGAGVVACSSLAVFSMLRVVDGLVDHSWESINNVYQ